MAVDRARACDGKMTIDGSPYAYRMINRASRVNPIDVSNSEGITGDPAGVPIAGYASTLPDLRSGEFTVNQAMFVASDNPYEDPVLLHEGGYYDLQFFPSGDDLGATAPADGAYLCVEVGEQGTVNQGALIPSARFRSDGAYTNPGEVPPVVVMNALKKGAEQRKRLKLEARKVTEEQPSSSEEKAAEVATSA